MSPVVNENNDQKTAKNGEDDRVERQAEPPKEEGEHDAGRQLNQRVLPVDERPATPAAPAKQHKTHQRDIVVPGNRLPTARTARPRPER